jgi:hypothetical protein
MLSLVVSLLVGLYILWGDSKPHFYVNTSKHKYYSYDI